MADSNNYPLVSVVIPMFNSSPFIKDMLECMENQTYNNWELIIVDDGSTDDSCNIVNKFASNDLRIKLMHRSPDRIKGGNTCRNIGYEEAKGEFIIWMDADDLIAPYCIKQRVEYLLEHIDLDFAVFPLIGFRNEVGDTFGRTYGFYYSGDVISRFIANFPFFTVVTNIYRRKSMIAADIKWDEELRSHQDVDMNLECMLKGLRFASPEMGYPDYYWRLSGNIDSVSKKIYTESHLKTNIYYFRKQVERFNNLPKYKKALSLLVNYIYKVLLFQSNQLFTEIFLSEQYFEGKEWLKFRLSVVNKFQHLFNWTSHIPSNILTFLLLPIWEIKYRMEVRDWTRRQKEFAIKLESIH